MFPPKADNKAVPRRGTLRDRLGYWAGCEQIAQRMLGRDRELRGRVDPDPKEMAATILVRPIRIISAGVENSSVVKNQCLTRLEYEPKR